MHEQNREQAVTLIGSDRAAKTSEVHFVCFPAKHQVRGTGLLRVLASTRPCVAWGKSKIMDRFGSEDQDFQPSHRSCAARRRSGVPDRGLLAGQRNDRNASRSMPITIAGIVGIFVAFLIMVLAVLFGKKKVDPTIGVPLYNVLSAQGYTLGDLSDPFF